MTGRWRATSSHLVPSQPAWPPGPCFVHPPPPVGHEGAVEDLQWSPSEETVFASCSTDHSIRIWDCRERGRPMLTAAEAHASDVNVISWNRMVSYMLASGADDGGVRIWDLRTFASAPAAAGADGGAGGPSHVAQFAYHRSHVTSVEWCPYEGSMLASSSGDNQLAVRWGVSGGLIAAPSGGVVSVSAFHMLLRSGPYSGLGSASHPGRHTSFPLGHSRKPLMGWSRLQLRIPQHLYVRASRTLSTPDETNKLPPSIRPPSPGDLGQPRS